MFYQPETRVLPLLALHWLTRLGFTNSQAKVHVFDSHVFHGSCIFPLCELVYWNWLEIFTPSKHQIICADTQASNLNITSIVKKGQKKESNQAKNPTVQVRVDNIDKNDDVIFTS